MDNEKFRQTALDMGYDPNQVDSFMKMVSEYDNPANDYREAPGTEGSTETVVTDEAEAPRSVVPEASKNKIVTTIPTTTKTINPTTGLQETKTIELPISQAAAEAAQPTIQDIQGMFNTPVSGSSATVKPNVTPSSESFFRMSAFAAEPNAELGPTPTPQQPIEGVEGVVEPTPTPTPGVKRVIPTGTKIYNNYGAKSKTLWSNGGGKHWGTDYAFEVGTPLSVPEGDWEVSYAWNNAKQQGYLRNRENSGYGNSMIVKNRQTGETIRYSHLSDIPVKPGQIVKSGDIVAITGNTGNSNAPHVDVEYRDASGNWSDIRKSPYKKYY